MEDGFKQQKLNVKLDFGVKFLIQYVLIIMVSL